MTEVKGRGFILRVVPGQDADVIVRILTAQGEKLSAFAKAGLKSRKRFAGSLQPLLNIEFQARKKASQELFFLKEASIRHEFPLLRGDIERLAAASYAVELIDHSAQEGLEHPELYNLLGAGLKAFEVSKALPSVLRQFEVKLLAVHGWLPTFHRCGQCHEAHEVLYLDAHHGVVTCSACGRSPHEISHAIRNILSGFLTMPLAQNSAGSQEVKLLEPLTQALLQIHLGHQKLKSVQFWGGLRRFQK